MKNEYTSLLEEITEKLGEFKKTGSELRFNFCPICNKHSKENPNFSINSTTGVYHCFSQGIGGHVKQLEGFKDLDVHELKKLNPIKNKPQRSLEEFKEVYNNLKELNSEWIVELKRRGITSKSYKIAGLGKKDKNGKNMLAVHITDGKNTVGIKYKSIDKGVQPSCESGSRTDFFFNWQEIVNRESLILVEGEMDLMTVIESGFDNCVSLPFGAGNTKVIDNQREFLLEFKNLIIATDKDDAGNKCKAEIVKKLKGTHLKLLEVELGVYKDFNEVLMAKGKEAIKEILDRATEIKGVEGIEIVEEVKEKEVDGRVSENKNGYSITKYKKDDEYEEVLTDFILEIEWFTDEEISLKYKFDGEVTMKNIRMSYLSNLEKFRSIGAGTYFGDTKDLPFLKAYLMKKYRTKRIITFDYVGYYENLLMTPEGSFNGTTLDSSKKCMKQGTRMEFELLEPLTDTEKTYLGNNILKIRNEKMLSYLIISYMIGNHFKFQDKTYPILHCDAETGAGKTETIEHLLLMCFGGGVKRTSVVLKEVSNAVFRNNSTSNNLTPMFYDEIKILNDRAKELDLLSKIRHNSVVSKGLLNGENEEIKVVASYILAGESIPKDTSVVNRSVVINFTRQNKGDNLPHVLLPIILLKKIALEISRFRVLLKTDDLKNLFKGFYDELVEVGDGRTRDNCTYLLLGASFLKDVIGGEFARSFNDFKEYLIETQNSKIITESDNFREIYLYCAEHDMFDAGEFEEPFHYVEKQEIRIRWELFYKKLVELKSKNVFSQTLLPSDILRKQLINSGVLGKSENKTLGYYLNKQFIKKAYVLNLK